MENKKPSIFNDVIGPVMRGPSSSHTAASWRMATVCRNILNEPIKNALIEFDKEGAWAENYREQGTVIGINGGLLGLDINDDKMKNVEVLAKRSEIQIRYEINSFPTRHTNTVRFTLEGGSGKKLQFVAVSTGGGAFEVQQVDNYPVTIHGDYFEMLIWNKKRGSLPDEISSIISKSDLLFNSSELNSGLINLKSPQEFQPELISQLNQSADIEHHVDIQPVLPIFSGREKEVPFESIDSLLSYAEKNKIDLADIGLIYEKCRSGLSDSDLRDKMEDVVEIIDNSIKKGLKGTIFNDRILPQQSHLINDAAKQGKILKISFVNNIIANVSAIMEAKSAMEVIVANPTAGSCGTVGGVLRAVADELNSSNEEVIKSYFASGIIGAYFAQGPGFSAEEHGCQVECGAASGMAAAGIVQLMGGSAKQGIDAASMAIQNMIGLVCDPVADRVEVPCLGKNVSAAMNALSSATMACSDFDAVIPLEEVIQTVSRVGNMMPTCVKCTGKGGLAISNTSFALKEQLKNNEESPNL
jgi:L-serine dehydratase